MRSPEAPHEPRSGMSGSTSWLSSSSRRSTSSSRTPELPLARQFARNSIVARVTSAEAIGPVPAPRLTQADAAAEERVLGDLGSSKMFLLFSHA